jgi:hypothetical protein
MVIGAGHHYGKEEAWAALGFLEKRLPGRAADFLRPEGSSGGWLLRCNSVRKGMSPLGRTGRQGRNGLGVAGLAPE